MAKSSDCYAENYCQDCLTLVKEAREHAVRENQDIGAAQRSALAQRAHSTHRNRPDPRYPVTKNDGYVSENQ
jgi:hypothetical protein